MPLPTWLYAQGLHPGWNQEYDIGPVHVVVHVQPDPQEILVQALSVVAAGGKGVMWFQTSMAEADYRPARWDAISRANWSMRGVARYLREGDLIGAVPGNDVTIADAIRARDAIVVPVINIDTATAPSDIACAAVATEGMVPHWTLRNATPTVTVHVPADFGVVDVFEVTDGVVADPAATFSFAGRDLTFAAVPLSNSIPVRVFVVAGAPGVRAAVAAAVAH
jgi:hypothetical protein